MDSYRIVLADDHVMLRQGIKKIIEESREMKVVSEQARTLAIRGAASSSAISPMTSPGPRLASSSSRPPAFFRISTSPEVITNA